MLAERVLFHFFFWTFIFVQGIFTYIIYYHHRIFIKAQSIQLSCGNRVLEKNTLRYQLRQEYLERKRDDINIYNLWRGWVIFIPLNIVFAIFMFVKYPNEIDTSFYYIMILLSIYQAYVQISFLTIQYGYPAFYTLYGATNGSVQTFISYYTQDYADIYKAIEEKIDMCHDPNADYSCWDLLPSILRENLTKRYISDNTGANSYQAIDYFEKAMREKNYDKVIAYMNFDKNADDLDVLGLSEHPFRNFESVELVNFMKSVYSKVSIHLVLPWVVVLYLLVFHPWYVKKTFA